ncbi:hypothetical protein ABZ915_30615 [Streptomyces sp. NPDC046915]|uniref:hypothetical protein n=1 Tax=Streptomyces sp. NPDC046915 TaxID=3155257 RepID=UPI0033E6D9F3
MPWRRVAGGLLLAVLTVSAAVGVHVQWVRTAEHTYADRVVDPEADAGTSSRDRQARAAAEKTYRAKGRPTRTGTTVISVAPVPHSGGSAWRLTARSRIALRPGDPMIDDLRRDDQNPADWLPFELSVKSGSDDCEADYPLPHPAREWLRQDGPRTTVYASVTATARWAWSPTACSGPGGDWAFILVTLESDKGAIGTHGLYDRWTVDLTSDVNPVYALDGGTTLRQSATGAEVVLPARGVVSISLDGPETSRVVGGGDLAQLGSVLQSYRSEQREALALLAAVAAVAGFLVVPFLRGWAPPATRTRWTAAAAVAAVLTAATMEYALTAENRVPWTGWWESAGRGMPLVVWGWVLLPFLLGAFVVRATRHRPPRLRELLPFLVPSVLSAVPAIVLGAADRPGTAAVFLGAAAVTAAATALLLRRGLLGTAGSRWAMTAAAGVWLAVLTAGPGTGLPTNLDPPAGLGGAVGAANQAAAYFLTWCWPAACWLLLASFGWPRWVAPTAGLALWLALAMPDASDSIQLWWKEPGGPWSLVGVFPTVAAGRPLTVVQASVLLTVFLTLWRRGRTIASWPPHVRALVVTVGVTAVASQLTRDGFSMLDSDAQRSGDFFAVTIAALGFAWLLPAGTGKRAARLHGTLPHAHNRRIHALLKDEILAAGRREYLSASRTALAEGELTPREWSTRWRRLGALGPHGMAPQRSMALRLAALGSSGGRSAWRNGLAGAVLLAVLSLPWVLYTFPSRLADTSFQLNDVIDEWVCALHWPLYGFVYGYAYPWLRGGSPIGKALCLLAVVLPAEWAELLYQNRDVNRFGVFLLLTAGNCLAVVLVLGLYWEARLVRAAGLRWGNIRNFRSLSAVAVPATTVLVAATTALATAMVGMWVSPDSGPATEAPNSRPSAGASRTPGP